MTNWSIIALGLNPAYQRTLIFDSVTMGEVNRAREMRISLGGKGQHAAKACNTLTPGSCACAQFLGGITGDEIAARMGNLGIPQLTVRVPAATRTCTTILNTTTQEMTELIDPSAPIPRTAAEQMRNMILTALPQARGVAVCGTYPPGIDETLYADLAGSKGSAFLLLDGYRGIESVLDTGKVDMLKVNAAEIRALTGKDEITSAAARCAEQYDIPWIGVTDGPGQAWLFGPESTTGYRIPPLGQVLNPIGAGDTCTGVTLLKIVEGLDVPSAFRWGLAAATASCRHLEGAVFTADEMARIHSNLQTSLSASLRA